MSGEATLRNEYLASWPIEQKERKMERSKKRDNKIALLGNMYIEMEAETVAKMEDEVEGSLLCS